MPKNDVTFTIKELAAAKNHSDVYIRRSILQNKLKAIKEPIAEGSETMRWIINEKDYQAWRAESGNRAMRKDGRKKYNLYATPSEFAELNELLAKAKNGAIASKPLYKKQKKAAKVTS